MLKKIAAFGLSAALVLSPLAAFAQTDTTAPAAPAAGAEPDTMAKPMKAKPKHHAKKHTSKKMKAPGRPAAPRRPGRMPPRANWLKTQQTFGRNRAAPSRRGGFFCLFRLCLSPRHAKLPPTRERPMAAAEFWYEFASTYSYPAAMRVAPLAKARGVELTWRPFLLGPIFAANGWRDSPFNIYPSKGRYMWRDMERICDALGPAAEAPRAVPPKQPACRPRGACAWRRGAGGFLPPGYAAEFGDGLPIADRAAIATLLTNLGLDAESVLARAEDGANKALLKAEIRPCSRARRHWRAQPRDGRQRSLLGQRQARAGTGLGGRQARLTACGHRIARPELAWSDEAYGPRNLCGASVGSRSEARASGMVDRGISSQGRDKRVTLRRSVGRFLTDGFHLLGLFAIGGATVWAAGRRVSTG